MQNLHILDINILGTKGNSNKTTNLLYNKRLSYEYNDFVSHIFKIWCIRFYIIDVNATNLKLLEIHDGIIHIKIFLTRFDIIFFPWCSSISSFLYDDRMYLWRHSSNTQVSNIEVKACIKNKIEFSWLPKTLVSFFIEVKLDLWSQFP